MGEVWSCQVNQIQYLQAHSGIRSKSDKRKYSNNKTPACFLIALKTNESVSLRADCFIPFKPEIMTRSRALELYGAASAENVTLTGEAVKNPEKMEALQKFRTDITSYKSVEAQYGLKGQDEILREILSGAARHYTEMHPEWNHPKVNVDFSDIITVHP